MLTRGQATANTFLVPERGGLLPQQPQNIQQGNGPDDSAVPNPVDGLQFVENVTKDYYNKWAELKSFVGTAWKNFGIDVTKPDFNKPESIKMHEIYNKAVADLRYQGDQLKTSQTELSKVLADQRAGKVLLQGDPSQAPVTQTSPQDLSVSTSVDPIVTQVNEFSKRRFFTTSEYNQALKGFNDAKTEIKKKKKHDPQNSAYWERQLQSLQSPTKSVKIFAPTTRKEDTNKHSAGGSLLKKVSNIISGSGDNWKRATTIDPLKLQNDDFKGDVYGEFTTADGKKKSKVINTFLYDPENETTTIIYEDSEIPSDVLGKRDALSVARQLVSSNPKLGTLQTLDKYIETNSLLDDEGEVDPIKLISKNMANKQLKNLNEIAQIKPFIAKATSKIKSDLSNLGRLPGIGGEVVFDLSEEFGGGKLVIQRGFRTGKLMIDNIDDIYPGMSKKEKKEFENLTDEQVISFLTTSGILESEAQKLIGNSIEAESTTEIDEDI